MTEAELRRQFEAAKSIIRRERQAREFVFRHDPIKRKAKLEEIDMLLHIVAQWKDELKLHMEPDYRQASMLEEVES